jgi:AraC-like DNA-binding protein
VTTRYAEFPPPAELADHVACLWTFEGEDPLEDQRIVPDGRSELIVHRRTPYLERSVDGRLVRQPAALFAGQLTRPLHLRADGPVQVAAVRFESAGAHAYLGQPLKLATNRRLPLAVALEGDTEAELLASLARHVHVKVAGRPPDPAIAACVAALRDSEGGISLDQLSQHSGLSPRVLQRRFADVVGISPRMLAAIIRFRRVFDASGETWSETAQAAGYFDHPQMAREFRRFVGCTPTQFMAGEPGLAKHLVANLQGAKARTS